MTVHNVFDALNGSRMTRSYIEKALSGGLSAAQLTVNNYSTIRPYPTLAEALGELSAIRTHFAGLDDVALVVERAEDFDRASDSGRLAVVLGYQNVPDLAGDLRILACLADLGIRCIQIAHNRAGPYAAGCADPADKGLTSAGRDLIRELNRLRIVIDLSHTGERSTIEALQLSSSPVCITHANSRAVCDNVRNKSDAVLDALKVNGGVLGLCYLPPMVRMGGGAPAAADVLAHVLHVRDRLGPGFIGIGSDFIEDQPAERYQEFLRHPEVYGTWPWRFPIADLDAQQDFIFSLADHGFSVEDMAAFAGGNFLRAFRQVIQ
ncbi:MAG: dipeptidase [Phreatobacter sp.]|uniref:dipeptidase n=1 Tax=Phreatobacter sp. TaxID=1966341 RepID=UPI004035E279